MQLSFLKMNSSFRVFQKYMSAGQPVCPEKNIPGCIAFDQKMGVDSMITRGCLEDLRQIGQFRRKTETSPGYHRDIIETSSGHTRDMGDCERPLNGLKSR